MTKNEPEWKKHNGSAVCPVPAGHEVEIRRRDGVTLKRKTAFHWEGDIGDLSVTHYRDWTAFEQQQASAGVPEWAIERARELAKSVPEYKGPTPWAIHYQLALARYIAAHEPAPVDPLEAAENVLHGRGDGTYDEALAVIRDLLKLARGVTVAKGAE